MNIDVPKVLRTRRFKDDDQLRFAQFSGDSNPLHVDSVEARRTMLGAPVVHGMHLVLLALEALGELRGRWLKLAAIRVRFPNAVLVDDEVQVRLISIEQMKCRIEAHVEADLVLDLTVAFREEVGDKESRVSPLEPMQLHELTLGEMAGLSGSLQVGVDRAAARLLFPGLTAHLGLATVAELLALTRLVGMRCPGRHSLFSQFDVVFEGANVPAELRFRVERVDDRFRRVVIRVQGRRLNGNLIAFVRPSPEAQPRIEDLARRLRENEFRGSRALVVGGSRGLGETTAKLLAAGGAQVTITYYRGKQDAARVVEEITSWGGCCECVELNVLDPGDAIRKIFAVPKPPSTIYYFATPRIFARRRAFFSRELLQKFIEYYVVGFSRLIDLAILESGRKLRIFFPSTVAIGEDLREIAEYTMAKRTAEDLCSFYNRLSCESEIVVERLPRIRTDQTATLIDMPADDSAKVLLPILRKMEPAST